MSAASTRKSSRYSSSEGPIGCRALRSIKMNGRTAVLETSSNFRLYGLYQVEGDMAALSIFSWQFLCIAGVTTGRICIIEDTKVQTIPSYIQNAYKYILFPYACLATAQH